MNYGDLRTHFKALLNRSDITDALANTFIDQGIARIQRTLRIPSMEKAHTYAISAQTSKVTIPNDFLEAIDLIYDNHTLSRVPMKEMQDYKKAGQTGSPHYFTREGGSFLLYPEPTSGSLILNYYSQYTALSADSDTNVLTDIASDLICYAALVYASDYYLDERRATFENAYFIYLTEIQEQANDAEMSGSLQSIRPAYQLDI
tara:strand:+ start:10251 stop:10859 length:609 start_codon:yes stop_codon:yes gene_type:complete